MLCGLRQAIEIGREAFCLGAWRHTVGAHEQQLNTRGYARPPFFSRQYLLYNTVVITESGRSGLFQSDERSWIARATDLLEVPHEVRFWINELGSEDLSPNLYCLSIVGDGCVVGRSAERKHQILINEMVLELVGHAEDGRFVWQPPGKHHRDAAFIIEICCPNVFEIWPEVDTLDSRPGTPSTFA